MAELSPEASIAEITGRMEAGELTAQAVADFYLRRIAALDASGPRLASVLALDPTALEQAAARDAERQRGQIRGPLHGVPVVIKDNIETAGPLPTTAGSLALADAVAAADAPCVAALRAAGAVILGKANLSEWANFRSTCSSSGWSSLGGQTRNPYALDRTPGGSSSGSAVAAAAGLCAAAIGTETDGSITHPAHANSLVGIKPTVGLVSRQGIVPVAHSQDTAGPLARSVADAALLLAALAPALRDDLVRAVATERLSGTRLGVARGLWGFDRRVGAVFTTCLEALASLGAELVDPVDVSTIDELAEPEYERLLFEFHHDLDAYLAALGPETPVHSLEELMAFNEEHAERVMPYFGQEHFAAAAARGSLDSADYRRVDELCRRLSRDEGIDAALARHDVAALVAPTYGPAWLIDHVVGDNSPGGSARLAAVAGYPHVTVPAGFIAGLPVGVSFFGADGSEAFLTGVAAAFERIHPARRTPGFAPTAHDVAVAR